MSTPDFGVYMVVLGIGLWILTCALIGFYIEKAVRRTRCHE